MLLTVIVVAAPFIPRHLKDNAIVFEAREDSSVLITKKSPTRRPPSENEELVEKRRGKDDGERPGHRTPKPKRTPKPTRKTRRPTNTRRPTRRPSQPSSQKRRIRAANSLVREDWKDGECSGKKLSERCEQLKDLVCQYRRSELSRRERTACETASLPFGRKRRTDENEELVESEEEQDLVMKEE